MNDTALVLQGYSTSKEQLQKIYDAYNDMGFTNIVISNYSNFVPDNLINEDFVILNDEILGKYDRKTQKNSSGLNYQILTTKHGINYVVNKLTDIKYVVKLRADHFFDKLNIFVRDWINEFELIKQPENDPFEKKIVTMGMSNKYKPHWYISDYFSFGTVNDMYNLWNIPTTFTDNTRAEDYVNTFYLIKHFSKMKESEVEKTIRNSMINKYSNSPTDYFIFDNRVCNDVLYSHKSIHSLGAPGYVSGCAICNFNWAEKNYNFS